MTLLPPSIPPPDRPAPAPPDSARRTLGTVVSLDPLLIYVGGNETRPVPATALTDATMRVGATVQVMEQGGDHLVLGYASVDGLGRPRARVYKTGSQSIPNATLTTILMDSIFYDPFGMLASGHALVAPIAGTYHATAGLRWEGGFTATGRITRLNVRDISASVSFVIASDARDAGQGSAAEASLATDFYMDVGDYVYMDVFHGGGGGVVAGVGLPGIPYLTLRLVD